MSDEQLDATAALHLPPEPASTAPVRRFIVDLCKATQMPAELCDTAALLGSELVANAVIHGKTSATIEGHRPPDSLRGSARDDNPGLPAVGTNPTLPAESGRGMQIVSVLAAAWGVERLGEG